MRITHNMLAATTLSNINVTMERLDRLQYELTSGQKIGKPSDDPIGAAASVQFRATISEIGQFIRNVDSADSWLTATDAALDGVSEVLHRVRELATRGANDTMSSYDRQTLATEVSQLLDRTIALGNSTYTGQYLFAGFRVATTPYVAVGNPPTEVSYRGDSGRVSRQIDNQSTVVANVPGNRFFEEVFDALIGLRDDLQSDNAATVSARIRDIDGALNTVLSIRSEVGARMNRIANQKDQLESLKVNITGLLSKTQDIDMTEAITQFSVQENVYKAALAAGAKSIQPSLLDYMR